MIADLLALMQQDDIDQRWRVAGELAQMGPAATLPILTLLPDVDWSIQHILIWVLGELCDERALPTLIAALQHEHLHVRLSAARALEKSDAPQAAAALMKFREVT